jgi:hypothetical protein
MDAPDMEGNKTTEENSDGDNIRAGGELHVPLIFGCLDASIRTASIGAEAPIRSATIAA